MNFAPIRRPFRESSRAHAPHSEGRARFLPLLVMLAIVPLTVGNTVNWSIVRGQETKSGAKPGEKGAANPPAPTTVPAPGKTAMPPGKEAPAANTNAAPAPKSDAEKLPKIEEMVLPTAEQLLKGKPVDWLVLITDEVIVASPVYPRPNTIAKVLEQIEAAKKWPSAKSAEERDQMRIKREALQNLSVVLGESDSAAEYLLPIRVVREVIHHEDLMLRRVGKLQDEGKLADAYELLYVLARRQPNWPKLEEAQQRQVFAESEQRVKAGTLEPALVFAEELHDRNKNFEGLKPLLGRIVGPLISEAVKQSDYRRARHFLHRLRQRESNHPVVVEWTNNLTSLADERISRAALSAGKNELDRAVDLVEEAALIWPTSATLKSAFDQHSRAFQRLRAGVIQLPNEQTSYFLPNEADRRREQLIEGTLFEPDDFEDVVRYKSGYFDRWEPADLGRSADFTLRQNRPWWESQPVLPAASVVGALQRRIDPLSPVYDERLASYIDTITLLSPERFRVQFVRAPPRTELLFAFPLHARAVVNGEQPTSTNEVALPSGKAVAASDGQPKPPSLQLISTRFVATARDAGHASYRRSIPEPSDASRRHVAEIVERKYASGDLLMQGLLRGEVSFLPRVQSWDILKLQGDNRFFMRQYALPAVHVLQCNPRSKAMAHRELRRALAYGIPRDRILKEQVLRDPQARFGRLVTAPFATKVSAYNTQVKQRDHDLTLAVALALASKKQLKGAIPELRLICEPDPVAREAATAMIRDWERIGLKVRLLGPDEARPARDSADWDLVYRVARIHDPVAELWPFLTFDRQARIEPLAPFPDWLRQELIELDAATDWNSAISLLHKLHSHLHEEVVTIPLWEVDEFLLARKNIHGFSNRPLRTYQDIDGWQVDPWFATEAPQ